MRLGSRAGCLNGAWWRVVRLGLTRFVQRAREGACEGFWALFLLFWTPLGEFFLLVWSKVDFEHFEIWALSGKIRFFATRALIPIVEDRGHTRELKQAITHKF
ncbi:unnamed protein product [Camellia sinensis]